MTESLLAIATDVAAAAARLLVEGFDRRQVVNTKSSRTDIVTQMDKASEALLVEMILAARPDDAIVGEEGSDRPGSTGITWVIDPLDGTVNYLYGFPSWAVSVGVLQEGRPVAGVVHAPALGSVWTGLADGGAKHNGNPIHVGNVASMADALVATGFGYEPEVRATQGLLVADLLPQIRDIRRAGAAAVDMCWVAQGVVDGYFERGTHIWDRAAAMAICRGAGAVVGGLSHDATDAMTIAANPALFGQLRDYLGSK